MPTALPEAPITQSSAFVVEEKFLDDDETEAPIDFDTALAMLPKHARAVDEADDLPISDSPFGI